MTEFTRFIGERFERTGMFLSADVFGAIIGSPEMCIRDSSMGYLLPQKWNDFYKKIYYSLFGLLYIGIIII